METVIELRDKIRNGELTAVQAVKNSLAVIAEKNEKLNAFLEVYEEEALKAAEEIDARIAARETVGELAGVPIAIKDNLLYKGHTASTSSKMLAEYKSAYTATAVQKLIDAGAVIIGRTNMDSFAMGSSTETSDFGNTINPWGENRIPGGSSGGSAVAVAAGMVPAAIGSDTGGSIRQPAAMCGIVGMKPSYGRISRYGLIAMASSLDQIGPMTKTVEDAVLLQEIMQGVDANDATSIEPRAALIPEHISDDMKGLKIGIPKEYFVDGMDEEVRRNTEAAIETLKENGAEIVEVSLPLTEYALPAYYIIQPAEVSSNLGRFDGMRYGTRVKGEGLLDTYFKTRGELFGKEIKRRILLGTFILSAGYYDAYYKKALAVKAALHAEMEKVFKEVDILLSPTTPGTAWEIGEKFNDPIAMYLSDVLTVSANITSVPAISVPSGFADGLPTGLQFIGPFNGDELVYKAAHWYQSLTDHHTKEA